MSEIVWDQILEKDGILISVRIENDEPDSFTFYEDGPLPPNVCGVSPNHFRSRKEAVSYAQGNYLAGRRTFGWRVRLPPFPE
jgi:hypothetical protein